MQYVWLLAWNTLANNNNSTTPLSSNHLISSLAELILKLFQFPYNCLKRPSPQHFATSALDRPESSSSAREAKGDDEIQVTKGEEEIADLVHFRYLINDICTFFPSACKIERGKGYQLIGAARVIQSLLTQVIYTS